uniref:uncharacterized protein LOC122767139 isoform X2 n=1 Tax=Solea senegalensis TaxID=28829 RepID=UPI001CD8E7A3|nr:uncharacterized protein LOC122767139 isoform X2 [Solea senegalensis]
MADEAAVVEEGAAPAENPLVAVTFQKNLQRAQKYLESEPKALGITQICFSLFHIILIIMLIAQELASLESGILFLIASPLVMIAGCVAIVAQNLNLTMHTHSHIAAEIGIVHAALFAISATLAAYSCKVVNCCSAAPRMTVITVQAPAVQQ